jgi:hypothetical protein
MVLLTLYNHMQCVLIDEKLNRVPYMQVYIACILTKLFSNCVTISVLIQVLIKVIIN